MNFESTREEGLTTLGLDGAVLRESANEGRCRATRL
jgi:hypothetical protein